MNVKKTLTNNAMIIITVLVIILLSVLTGGKLLLPQNVNNLIAQNAYVFILGTGMLLCILTGGNIDLSVGSVVAFIGGIGGALIVNKHWSIPLVMLIMILVGIAVGLFQGYFVAYVRVPPFIVTLAGMLAFRGLANVVLNGMTISPLPDNYLNIFNSYIPDFLGGNEGFNLTCFVAGIVACIIFVLLQLKSRINKARKGYETGSTIGMLMKCVLTCAVIIAFMYKLALYKGIPVILVWVVAILLIYNYIATKTTIGRYFYAVGGNEKATKLSGINTNSVYFIAYINMAFLTAVTSMVCIARLNSANPTAGNLYEMDAIGACFIGGASAYGGVGTVGGIVTGAVLVGVLNLGMSIIGVDANWQKVVKGCVVLFAVIFDIFSKKKQQ
ncbi:MAG: sugar ABC transporter permease [Lachnospiraceae bacterium]|nr:sugar ABC transporter permease [Lachnospiraceae bacterium]